MFDNKTTFKLANTRRSTRSNHAPFHPHCPLPFYSIFSFTALMSLSRTCAYRHNTATMRQLYAPFYLILSLPLCSYSFTVTGTPEVVFTIQNRTNRRDSCMYISLPSCPSRAINQSLVLKSSRFSFPSLSVFTHSLASLSQQSSSGTAVCTILAGISRLSTLSQLSLFPPSPSLFPSSLSTAWMTLSPSQRLS